jgi:hypothetical protein
MSASATARNRGFCRSTPAKRWLPLMVGRLNLSSCRPSTKLRWADWITARNLTTICSKRSSIAGSFSSPLPQRSSWFSQRGLGKKRLLRFLRILFFREDFLTANARELTRINGSNSRPLASIRRCFSSLWLRLCRAVFFCVYKFSDAVTGQGSDASILLDMKEIRIYRHPHCKKCARITAVHHFLDWRNRVESSTKDAANRAIADG